MNDRQRRIEEAIRWLLLLLSGDPAQFDAAQRRAFVQWLQSIRNLAAFVAVWWMHGDIVKRELKRRTASAPDPKIVLLSDHLGHRLAEDTCPRELITRRGVLTGLAAGVSGLVIGKAVTSALDSTRPDVTASGHVLRVPLHGGLMRVARYSSFRIDDPAQKVHLRAGQAAFELWQRLQSLTRIVTPLCEITAEIARFGVVVFESTQVIVTVATGSVRVISAVHAREFVLNAGEKLILEPGARQVPVTQHVDAEGELSWLEGELRFTTETIAEAASVFNRFNQLRIVPAEQIAHLAVGSHRCVLTDPERFVERFATRWGLASRIEGNAIHIFMPDQRPPVR